MSYMRGEERIYGQPKVDSSVWDDLDSYKVVLKEKGNDLIVVVGEEETSIRGLTAEQLNNPTMRELVLNYASSNPFINQKLRAAIAKAGWYQGESIEL